MHLRNGTLVDEAFCEQMKEVGNLSLSISLEGFEEVNDLRRGAGVYEKVLHAMDLLKASGQILEHLSVIQVRTLRQLRPMSSWI